MSSQGEVEPGLFPAGRWRMRGGFIYRQQSPFVCMTQAENGTPTAHRNVRALIINKTQRTQNPLAREGLAGSSPAAGTLLGRRGLCLEGEEGLLSGCLISC